MRHARNFVLRLSINYILLNLLLALRGVNRDQQLFGVWIVAFVFTTLTVTVRRLLLTLTLPFVIMTAGLFIFVIDGFILVLTAAFTRLNIANFSWALAGVFVMANANIWVERAFRAVGWLKAEIEGPENIVTSRSPRWPLRIVLYVILLFGIVFSAAMAWQVFLVASTLTKRIVGMTVAAGIGFALFVAAIAWLVAEGLALARRARFSLIVSVLATLGIITPISVRFLALDPVDIGPPPAPRLETRTWDLPTGSHIAYSFFAAKGNGTQRNPIIFLHGGPGKAVLETDIAFFRRFTEYGWDVYLYDQVGSGLSGQLERIEGYSVWRHSRDLEAIREHIRADRLILIAHGYGSEIAARYMVEHRDRVERVVFYSPTSLWDDEQFAVEQSRTAALLTLPYTWQDLRPTVARAIAAYSPRSAESYVPQPEMIAWSDLRVDERTMVCSGYEELAPQPEAPGYNRYAEVVGKVTADRAPDPRPSLGQILIPTILLRGECDPVDEGVVKQYQDTLPYLQVYEIEDAGSMLHLSQPDLVRDIILAFLNKQDIVAP